MKVKNQVLKLTGAGDVIELDYIKFRIMKFVFKAVDHRLRRKVIALLQETPTLYVGQIHKKLKVKLRQPGLKQATVSTNLAILRKAGICIAEKKGKFVYYSLIIDNLEELAFVVETLYKKYKKFKEKK
ncbi:MAG: ArsR family transcriptional regulator, virulence s transcriptional regulator [Patescibacteria group bacterium]|nr:ArsR family transcriptional regulator, virulence s transcriptional regulator [Patescibacteria group bacterium]